MQKSRGWRRTGEQSWKRKTDRLLSKGIKKASSVKTYTFSRNKAKELHRKYIASAVWERRRSKYFREHRNACAACDFTFGLHLHHKDYSILGGKEPDENLAILCGKCHEDLHKMYGTKDLFINTELFIKNYHNT